MSVYLCLLPKILFLLKRMSILKGRNHATKNTKAVKLISNWKHSVFLKRHLSLYPLPQPGSSTSKTLCNPTGMHLCYLLGKRSWKCKHVITWRIRGNTGPLTGLTWHGQWQENETETFSSIQSQKSRRKDAGRTGAAIWRASQSDPYIRSLEHVYCRIYSIGRTECL